jgi:hypothetical protein
VAKAKPFSALERPRLTYEEFKAEALSKTFDQLVAEMPSKVFTFRKRVQDDNE